MIIADDFVFFHMPRTGGTSITCLMVENIPSIEEPPAWLVTFQHEGPAYLKDIRNHLDKFWFAFIRNPFDWYVSYWAKSIRIDKGIPFRKWLWDALNEENIYHCSRIANFNIHFQVEAYEPYEEGSSGFRILAQQMNARDTKFDIGFMTHRYLQTCCNYQAVYFDNFPNWINRHNEICLMDKVCKMEDGLGVGLKSAIGMNGSMPHENISERRPYREYYNKELIDLVYYKDRFIFDTFRYSY